MALWSTKAHLHRYEALAHALETAHGIPHVDIEYFADDVLISHHREKAVTGVAVTGRARDDLGETTDRLRKTFPLGARCRGPRRNLKIAVASRDTTLARWLGVHRMTQPARDDLERVVTANDQVMLPNHYAVADALTLRRPSWGAH